jgi:2-methylaconitate cis-trans-isomerase PrpF
MYMHTMRAVNGTLMRAGTSRGVYLLDNELPKDSEARDKVLLAIYGSPDKRQIDGMGGADPLTSKTIFVGPSKRPGIDVEYTFGQVDIEKPQIFYKSMCGNMTSGVGPFSVYKNLVNAEEGLTTVRMLNRNTGKILIAEVEVAGGKLVVNGDYAIAGVPGTGAKTTVNFSETVGALANKGLLPTGKPVDRARVEGVGEIDISIVDMAACQVFVRASDLGLTGREPPQEIDSNPEILAKLEAIRAQAAWMAGLADTPTSASEIRKNTPHIVFVGPLADYAEHLTGKPIKADDIDILARNMFMQIMHKTYPGTGSICTAVASQIPCTIANEFFRKESLGNGLVRLGHPAGIIEVETRVKQNGSDFTVERAAIGRTARVIMEGQIFVPERLFHKENT